MAGKSALWFNTHRTVPLFPAPKSPPCLPSYMHKKSSPNPAANAQGAVAKTPILSRGFSPAAVLLAAMLAATSTAHATNLYWDTNGATAGSGAATGNWDGSTALWTTDSTGAITPAVTVTTISDDLFFSADTNGTTGTVTVSGTQSTNSITFDDNVAVTISGGTQINLGTTGSTTSGITVASGDNAGNTISTGIALGVNSTVTNNGTGTLTLGGVISGSGFSLTKAGTGTLALNGANTYTGGTTISAGTLIFNNASAFGTGAITSNGGTIRSGAALTTTNNLVVNSATTLETAGNWTVNGNISGSGDITRGTTATQSLFLGGDNSGYTGTFTIQNSSNSIVRFSSTTSGSANAKWVVNQPTSTRASINFGNGTIQFGSLTGTGKLTGQGAAGTTTVVEVGNLGFNETFSGVLEGTSGTIALTKVGTGTWTLSGANTYTGTTIVNGGTLQMNSTNATSSSVTVNSGATLALNIGDAIGFTASKNLLTINSGGTVSNITPAARVTIWNDLTMTGGTLTSTGTGDANGAYSLNTQVIATSDVSGNAALISGGPISLQNRNTANGVITFNVTRGSATPASDLTVSANIIANSSAANVGLTKTGTGIMTLSGANTYTGGTTVSAGTLALGTATTLQSATGAVIVNGGTLTSSVASTTLGGNLTLSGGSLAANGTGAGTIVLAANKSFSMTSGTFTYSLNDTITGSGTGTFDITGGIFDLTNSITDYGIAYTIFSGFSSGSISGLTFTNYDTATYAANLGTNGQLTFSAIPEPATYAALAGLGVLGLAIYRRRRFTGKA